MKPETSLDEAFPRPSEPKIDPDAAVFDAGAGAIKEPMSLEQLEARLPDWKQQPKAKLKPVVVYTPQMHREADAKYYSGRPRAMGSETQRRAVLGLRRAVTDHGAHSIRGLYGAPRDALPDAPKPTYQHAPETTMGYCRECSKAIPKVGVRSDTLFCSEAHSKAFRRREAQRREANKAFVDYHQSEQAKAEAALADQAYHEAGRQMKESAARAGIEGATFFATPAGVVGRADNPLPPVRIKVVTHIDHPSLGAIPAKTDIEVQTSSSPEHAATLYTFSLPDRKANEIGRVVWLEVRLLGDPGSTWPNDDAYLTPEQEAVARQTDAEKVEFEALYAERRSREARQEAAHRRPTSARDAHAEERMANLLARPDHDVIIAEFEADKDWSGLKEFYRARNRQNAFVRDNATKTQSKQRVS
jgi:hypothetical protein